MMSQDALNKLAYEYACERAKADPLCEGPTIDGLGDIDRCICLGDYYGVVITTNVVPVLWAVHDGTLPPGLDLHPINGYLSGITSAIGTYVFTVRAYAANNSFADKTYSITVLTIVTDTLPNYTLGTPYSEQLVAAGGSGEYAWNLESGTLPTGLTLSADGLISGTPTASGSGPLVFKVTDTVCEGLNKSSFSPNVRLTTSATTTTRIKRGYSRYVGNTGPVYKKATWSGTVTQIAKTLFDSYVYPPGSPSSVYMPIGSNCGGAKYVFSGVSEINSLGQFISHHRKDLYVECPNDPWPDVAEGSDALLYLINTLLLGTLIDTTSRITKLVGYCWAADNRSCPTCDSDDTTWVFKSNNATDSQWDSARDLLMYSGLALTATTLDYSGSPWGLFAIANTANLNSPYIEISSSGSYSAVLSDEYTEAEAIATETTKITTGATAENKPDYLRASGQQWLTLIYSSYTTVDFTMHCTDLLIGSDYYATYELWDNDGSHSVVTVPFTATAKTQNISGTLPTPSSGHSLTMKNPKLVYA